MCNADCSIARCGDGIVNLAAGEQCDDAGESAKCNSNCTLATCGDRVINASRGEQCDDGAESRLCDSDCTLAICGDGAINRTADEICDDAGESSLCDDDCTLAECGDGVPNAAADEECDDIGQTKFCETTCKAPVCGDHIENKTVGEECDDGGESRECNIDCTTAICGDGKVNAMKGEQCDGGAGGEPVDTSACDEDCSFAACGDGYVNGTAGEACDDENRSYDGNGCSAACAFTTGMTCEAGTLPGQMNNLGVPFVEGPGVAVEEGEFFAIRNETRVFEVPLPEGEYFALLPLVTSYDPNDDELNDWTFSPRVDRAGGRAVIEVAISGVNENDPAARIRGKLVVFGFDGIRSASVEATPRDTFGGGERASVEPAPIGRRTKVLPFAYLMEYRKRNENDLGWVIEHAFDARSCGSSFVGTMLENEGGAGSILWDAGALLLAESVRIDRKPFRAVNNGLPDNVPFYRAHRDSTLVWLPMIEAYVPAGSDDLSFIVDCVPVTYGLDCFALAWDGSSGNDASVAGEIIMLEYIVD
ncbi:hypothetical protein [Haliangium sp.]|uniref:hypothetical protein n=1 Tax=Haliangium sp. TaxID=2663208 RepID=UPI003D12E3B3